MGHRHRMGFPSIPPIPAGEEPAKGQSTSISLNISSSSFSSFIRLRAGIIVHSLLLCVLLLLLLLFLLLYLNPAVSASVIQPCFSQSVLSLPYSPSPHAPAVCLRVPHGVIPGVRKTQQPRLSTSRARLSPRLCHSPTVRTQQTPSTQSPPAASTMDHNIRTQLQT